MPGQKDPDTTVQQTFDRLDWADDARSLIDKVEDKAVRENIGLRAEKSARRDASNIVQLEHVEPFLEDVNENKSAPVIVWRAASLARLNRVPEAFRDQVRTSIERFARDRGVAEIGGDLADEAFEASRQYMCPVDHTKSS